MKKGKGKTRTQAFIRWILKELNLNEKTEGKIGK
jgi:hypothetical protein